MKTKSKIIMIVFLLVLSMLVGALCATPLTAMAAGSVRVDFCLTNGALENFVFFENDSSKYFITQNTKNDGTLSYLEELYRTDDLTLEFDGWYTEQGDKVSEETVFTEYTILYDRWKPTSLTAEDIISTLEIGTPLLEAGETAGSYNASSIVLDDDRLSVQSVSVYEGLHAYRTNKLDESDVLEAGKSYSLRVELHTKNGELIDDQLMNHSTATYGLVANMVYSHDYSGIFTTQWTNREDKVQVIINYDYENYSFTAELADKLVENGQSPQYTVYVSNNANVQGMELFVKNANDTWASLGAVTGEFSIPANSNVVKQYRVEVTYQNGFVISSNPFQVEWYDPNAPKFITQPTDYDVAYGTNVLVAWGLNCDVSSIYLEKFNGDTYSQYQNAYPTGTTVNALESGTYTFRVHATKDGGDIYSEDFTITWREKFVFTTQPQSVTVSTGESIVVTWETNLLQTSLQTLGAFQLQTDTGSGWHRSANLAENATSFDFGISYSAYSQKYRLMANYDGTPYYSDEFTIEYIAGVFTSKPADEINAIVGNDCLVEWDFSLDVEYYDIKVHDGNDFVSFATTDKPEYTFTASEVGSKQYFIQAYNANDQIIGAEYADYLMFRINWTEQQIVYLVSFNANGGTGTMPSVEQNASVEYPLPSCDFTAPEGMLFKSWSVNGAEKQVGETITVNSNTVVKAIWEEIPTYIVAYGPGESIGNTDFDYYTSGETVELLDPADLDYLPQPGMKFSHWNVCKDNALDPDPVAKQPGDTITVTFDTYVIAIWEEIPTYIVAYDANGGGGTMVGDVVEAGGTFTLEPCSYTAPAGQQFKAWAIGSPSGEQKQPNEQITINAETYIYAIWEDIPVVPTGLTASYSGTVLAGNKLNLGSLVVRLQYSDGSEQPCAGLCEYWYDGSQIQDPINYVFGVELIGTRTVIVKYLGFETTFELKIVGHPITFNANGGSGTMPATEYVGTYTLPGCTFTAPSGKLFAGWATSAQGEVIGDTYSVTAAVEFFAIWQDPPHECEPVLQSGQPATCQADGYKDYYACSCGAYYEDADGLVSIPNLEAWKLAAGKIAAAHSGTPEWHQSATSHEKKYSCCDEIVVASEPHEWNNGACAECGYVCLHVDVAVTKQDGQPATCTVDGWKDYYQCACGKYFADEARTTPISDLAAWKLAEGKIAAAHSYGELIPQQDAVHTQTQLLAGMAAHYVCSVCHGYFDANKVATTENALIIPAPQHAYGDWVLDNEKHWKVCSCGLKAEESTHDYTDNDDMICNSCGYDRTLPHTCGSATKQDGQSATCTLNGWKDYYKCSCGKLYQEEDCLNEILSLEEWKNGDGKIAAAHTYGELISKVDPTCSAPGMAAHYECSVCHVLFDEAYAVKTAGELTLDIDPTAHTYGAWTSGGDGTHTRVCTLNAEHKEHGNCAGGTATCTEKAVCSTCATAYGDTAAHSHGSEWKTNENEHWNECTCGDKANQAPHADGDVDGKCDVCGYAVEILSPEPDEDNEGLGAGAIAGIAVASTVVAGLGGFAIFWFVIKKKSIADLLALFKKK